MTYTLDGQSFAVDVTLSRKPFATATSKANKGKTGVESETLGQSLDTTGMSQSEARKQFALGKDAHVIGLEAGGGYSTIGAEIAPTESSLDPAGGAMSVPIR